MDSKKAVVRKRLRPKRKKAFANRYGYYHVDSDIEKRRMAWFQAVLKQNHLNLVSRGAITDAHLAILYRSAQQGMSMDHIAHLLGLSKQELYNIAHKNEKVRWAILIGRASGNQIASDLLWGHIEKGNLNALMFYLRTRGGWSEKVNLVMQNDLLGDMSKIKDAEKLGALRTNELKEIVSILQKAENRVKVAGDGYIRPGGKAIH